MLPSTARKVESNITFYIDNISLPIVTKQDRTNLKAEFTPEKVWSEIQAILMGNVHAH